MSSHHTNETKKIKSKSVAGSGYGASDSKGANGSNGAAKKGVSRGRATSVQPKAKPQTWTKPADDDDDDMNGHSEVVRSHTYGPSHCNQVCLTLCCVSCHPDECAEPTSSEH